MSFDDLLATARAGRADADVIDELARQALAVEREDEALPAVEQAADIQHSARLWQWAGLLQRALDDHEAALRSFSTAAELDPGDAGIAHGHARVALEAGIEAAGLFETALRLAPGNPDMLLGLAAAKLAEGNGEDAERDLAAMLAAQPLWLQGHLQLAQLRSMLGRRDERSRSIERALITNPRSRPLWTALFDLAIRAGDFAELGKAVARSRAAEMPEEQTIAFAAIAASECGEDAEADRRFASIPAGNADPVGLWRVRHLLRTERLDHALAVIDQGLAGSSAANFWPYASLAWRLAGDPRSEWLEGDSRFASSADLSFAAGELDALAARLRSLHVAKGEYLDQSVRGGTQTDGPLLSRIDPDIRALRTKIVQAVNAYVAQLPSPDPRHPLLSRRRDRQVRFSGSWSVRLRSAGHHASHVHPQGWISSAFYVSLPPAAAAGKRDGWLELGSAPDELGLDINPTRAVEPVAGRLALFPSWMWHGTVPFEGGERLTVAFDVRPPK